MRIVFQLLILLIYLKIVKKIDKKFMGPEFTIISINWSEKLIPQNNDIIETIYKDYFKTDCLYQVYGDSPIYGRDSLLYIGRTKNIERRIKDHFKSIFNRINNLSLIFGNVEEQKIEPILSTEKSIEISEALLITMLKPSYNSVYIRDTNHYLKEKQKYLILNKGNRASLPLEVTNIWW